MSLTQICGLFQRAATLNPVRRSLCSSVAARSVNHTSRVSLRSFSSENNEFGTYNPRMGPKPKLSPATNPLKEDFSKMTNEELADTSTIPGWDLIHSPPGKMPRGALVGKVVSTKMQKTVNVAVDRYRIVPKIRKRMKYTRKFMAHDEHEVANMGDLVMIVPSQRISRWKHFMLRKIVRPKGQLY